ncbi:MAG: hypothetical protein NXI09_13980 [Bacteroidetes bacterium]|nr:hypothetical protein [Bacteroidota bacterium]
MKSLYLIIIVVLSQALQGQGFTREIILPENYYTSYYSPTSLDYGLDSNQIVIWFYRGSTGAQTKAALLYDVPQNQRLAFKANSTGPSAAKIRKLGPNNYLVKDGPGGGNSSYPTWSNWNLNGGKEGSVFPNRNQASFVSIKEDSIFVLNAKPLIWENDSDYTYDFQAHDTNTIYYLTYLNPAQEQYQIMDSIRLEPNVLEAGLQFLERSKQWEVLFGNERIRFKRASFKVDTSFIDSSLSLENFEDFHFYTKLYRSKYMDGGISQMFYNEGQRKIVEVMISLKDSTYFDYSPIFNFFEKRGLEGWSYQQFNGQPSDLISTKESSAIKDWFFHIEDTLYLFRLKSGIVEKQNFLLLKQFPNLGFVDCLSDSEGGFYILAREIYDSNVKTFLIYIDKNGRTETLVGDEPFNIHFNALENHLKVFTEFPNQDLKYRIIDASGRSLQEGSIKAYEGIQLGDWRTGIYYLLLWDKAGSLIGSKPFLKR